MATTAFVIWVPRDWVKTLYILFNASRIHEIKRNFELSVKELNLKPISEQHWRSSYFTLG